MTMPAGLYYVGDLCYVLHDEWDEVCNILFGDSESNMFPEGEFKLKDGRRFAFYSTAHGDGTFYDNEGNRYMVDAGSIGCIRIEDIRQTPENFINGGVALTFLQPFNTSTDGGKLTFGHITIDTDPEPDYEEDDDYALEEEF
jgi:hypothetical protein